MTKFLTVLAILLGLAFTFFGAEKFILDDKVFTRLAERSGIALFDPYMKYFTGVVELGIAAMFFIPATRRLASFAGLGVVGGAIGLHLSPWLGVSVPGIGIKLFFMAMALFISCGLYFMLSRAQPSGGPS